MSLSTSKITELAPDQDSLNAANKLMKPNKWPLLSQHAPLVWGECQGSGANPYRTVFDQTNLGYKCTCPSRKFPCKHVLALMWMFAEDSSAFSVADVPEWVTQWLGRRRHVDGSPAAQTRDSSAKATTKSGPKSMIAAQIADSETIDPATDPAAEARRRSALEKRSMATQQSIAAGLEELQNWIADQIRTGLGAFLSEPSVRCRTIAARLVDAKAQAMASRLDELPSRILSLPSEWRLDWLIQELGRIVLISKAWLTNPENPELIRLVGQSETRESIVAHPNALRVASHWEVVGEQIATRRDGLVSQSTWLMNLGEGTRFALLLDYFPASLGKRSSVFSVGEQFVAELAFYPARHPLRAVIAERNQVSLQSRIEPTVWPDSLADPFASFRSVLKVSPWSTDVPLLLPSGRLFQSGGREWWQSTDGSSAMPLLEHPATVLNGLVLTQSVGLWDGISLKLLSGRSNWGAWSYDH